MFGLGLYIYAGEDIPEITLDDIRQEISNAKSVSELKEIYKRLEEGSTLTDIANKFNVSVQAVGYINSGRNYYDDNRKYPINPNIPIIANPTYCAPNILHNQ